MNVYRVSSSAEINFYEVLGILPTATDAEINSAYRRLAIKFHPDKNPGDPSAAASFYRLSHARNVLTDRLARARHDIALEDRPTRKSEQKERARLKKEERILIKEEYLREAERAAEKKERKRQAHARATERNYLMDEIKAECEAMPRRAYPKLSWEDKMEWKNLRWNKHWQSSYSAIWS